MTWTQADEDDFQQRKREWMEQQDREDKEREKMASFGLIPKCPECGSHRYTEGVKAEHCEDCGYGASYW